MFLIPYIETRTTVLVLKAPGPITLEPVLAQFKPILVLIL